MNLPLMRRENMKNIREGLIPTVLGTAVTATGALLAKNSRDKADNVAWGIMGLGLAHIILGTIDLIQHKDDDKDYLM